MSDASEVKRYIPDSTPIYLVGESTPEPTTCVVLGRDHDRIVAELQAEVERLELVAKAAVECMRDRDLTIATQARVIEKLREQRDVELEDNCWNRGNGNIDNARRKYELELEAIEQGEGT